MAPPSAEPEGPPQIPLSTYVPPAGRITGPVPATQPELTVLPLLAAAHAGSEAAFVYDLGEPGWLPGLGLAGQAPRRAALTLDAAPMADLVTGRPRYDLLPLDLLGRLAHEPVALGMPAATHSIVRPLDAPVARTELRYLTGQEGVQFIGATHAQTRRPGFMGRDGRFGVLFHVAGVGADGVYDGSDVGGFRVLARVTLNRPRWGLAVTEYRTRIEAGARGAVTANTALYNPFAATVADEGATRVDVVHLLQARLRLDTGLLPAPTTASVFRLAQTARYTPVPAERGDLQVEAQRVGLALAQPIPLGTHRVLLRATAWRDAALDSTSATVLPTAEARSFAHVALTDSTVLGGTALRLGAGLDVTPEGTFFSGHVEAERRFGSLRIDAHVRYGGVSYGRAEVGGYVPDSTGGVALQTDGIGDNERGTQARLGARLDVGAFRLGVSALGVLQQDTRLLFANGPAVSDPDTGGGLFATLPGTLQRVIGTATLAFRPDARRGVYASTTAAVQQGSYSGSGSTRAAIQALGALPDAWGQAQIGFRALGVFNGVLDLDLALRGRAWTGFASRTFHPPSGLFPLPDTATPAVPAGGTLGLVLLTRLQKRASLYLVYENALAERAYAGTYVVPVYPIAPHHLRFGVFWTLFG
ncbi:MAG: hypothetical protein AAGF99_04620 [Bacteroidota bacterium]